MSKRKYKTADHISVVSLDDKNEYIDFINDRKNHKYPEGTKLQKHHIVPIHDGGWDDEENLISVSFDDHVQAHYLIGKVYESKLDQLSYQLMSGMEKDIYRLIRQLGAQETHRVLKERKENFWSSEFQTEMSKWAVEKDRAQDFKDRSEGGKIAGKLRWKDYLIKPSDKWIFSYQGKETICIFGCSDGGDVYNILQEIYPNPNFKRVSNILNGKRNVVSGWTGKRIIIQGDAFIEED